MLFCDLFIAVFSVLATDNSRNLTVLFCDLFIAMFSVVATDSRNLTVLFCDLFIAVFLVVATDSRNLTVLFSQCANHFDHLRFLPKMATNHTVNLAKSHTDT